MLCHPIIATVATLLGAASLVEAKDVKVDTSTSFGSLPAGLELEAYETLRQGGTNSTGLPLVHDAGLASVIRPDSACTALATKAELEKNLAPLKQAPKWNKSSVRDLHREYNNVFKYGNRNAASHLWSTFLLERAWGMSSESLQYMFSGFCAVSGSPVQPSDYNRYGLTLDLVPSHHSGETQRFGFFHYCCWPCVCDTQDFIKLDTRTIMTADGPEEFWFAVLGNPCEHPEALQKEFVQPFYGRSVTTLQREAQEVRCDAKGDLIGATLSDHGYVIINMVFDTEPVKKDVVAEAGRTPTPGRMSTSKGGKQYQSAFEFRDMCEDRKRNGYNSGMGEIFRKVAEITKIDAPSSAAALPSCEALPLPPPSSSTPSVKVEPRGEL